MARTKGADQSSPSEPRSVSRPSSVVSPVEAAARYGSGTVESERKDRDLEDSIKWDEV